MSKVRKAVIPAAGLGTRFLPATDYCGPKAPSGRFLAPPSADKSSTRAEGAPI